MDEVVLTFEFESFSTLRKPFSYSFSSNIICLGPDISSWIWKPTLRIGCEYFPYNTLQHNHIIEFTVHSYRTFSSWATKILLNLWDPFSIGTDICCATMVQHDMNTENLTNRYSRVNYFAYESSVLDALFHSQKERIIHSTL